MSCLSFAVFVLACFAFTSSLPTRSQLEDHVQRIARDGEVHGYAMGTLHALDRNGNDHKRLTKRDLRGHVDDTSLHENELPIMLRLSSGEELRMSLRKRSVDASAASFHEVNSEGRSAFAVTVRQCFFNGPVENGGHAFIALCDSGVTGTVLSGNRTYDVYQYKESDNNGDDSSTPPITSRKRSESDDEPRVLVTWYDGQREEEHDGIEIRDDGYLENDTLPIPDEKVKRSIAAKTVTVEIGNYLDSYFMDVLAKYKGLSTNQEIVDLMLNKWSGAAYMLSNKNKMNGWDVTLKIVNLELWRKNPSWYVSSPSDRLGTRMKAICQGTKWLPYDQVSLHTHNVAEKGRIGLSWIGGVCKKSFRCAAMRSANTNFMTELHEFGHSLGLNHDGKMSQCSNDNDQNGFMGGNRDYYRSCYTDILDPSFSSSSRSCLHSNDNPNTGATVLPIVTRNKMSTTKPSDVLVTSTTDSYDGDDDDYMTVPDGKGILTPPSTNRTDASSDSKKALRSASRLYVFQVCLSGVAVCRMIVH